MITGGLPQAVVTSSAAGVPAWAPATVYAVNTLVSSGGVTYIASTTHTSAATFQLDATNWKAVGATPAAPTTLLSEYTSQQSVFEPAFQSVNQVASPSGLSIGGGGLIATTPGASGTGLITLPSTIDPTKPFRLGVLINIANPADTNFTIVTLGADAGVANSAFYGSAIVFNSGGSVITLQTGGANAAFGVIPTLAGKYWFVVCGDGVNVHTCVIPAGRAGVYFGQAGITGISPQAEVVAQRSQALVSGGPAVNVYSNLSQIQINQKSGVNAIIGYDFSLGYSGTPLGSPAVFAPTIGAEVSTPLVRLPGSYTGKAPLDIVYFEHANASDEKQGQRYNDPDAGAAAAYLLAQGYAVVSARNGVDATTYTSATSSPWGAPAGIAGRRALLQWCATNLPGARYVYGVGQSMGLLDLLAMYRLYPGLLRAIAGISGVTNLSDSYTNRGFGTVINTAYANTTLAKVQDNDPNLRPALYAPTPLKLWCGDATDTTIPSAQNSLLFKTNVEAQGGSVPVTTIAGAGHLNVAALWDGPGLAAFFAANA